MHLHIQNILLRNYVIFSIKVSIKLFILVKENSIEKSFNVYIG